MAGIVAGSTAKSAGKSGHGLPDLHAGTVRRALTDAGQNRFTVLLPRRDNPDATATGVTGYITMNHRRDERLPNRLTPKPTC
jgi:hypothetical protein